MYYKDKLKNVCDNLLENIFECSYELDDNFNYYCKKIKANIAQIDFMLDRLYTNKYISSTTLYRIDPDLVEINKLVNGRLKVVSKNEDISK